VNRIKGELLLAECKVSGSRVDERLWQDPEEKANAMLQKHGPFTAFYGAFVVRFERPAERIQRACMEPSTAFTN